MGMSREFCVGARPTLWDSGGMVNAPREGTTRGF